MELSYFMCIPYDPSHGTIMFDLVTLTLKFDLLLKNFNLAITFKPEEILHMCHPSL